MPAPAYVLFKEPGDSPLLSAVRLLHLLGVEARPKRVCESGFPPEAVELPSIHDETAGVWHVGGHACARFLEDLSDIDELLIKAGQFDIVFPGYRMSRRKIA